MPQPLDLAELRAHADELAALEHPEPNAATCSKYLLSCLAVIEALQTALQHISDLKDEVYVNEPVSRVAGRIAQNALALVQGGADDGAKDGSRGHTDMVE